MFQHILDIISLPFSSESITQQQKISKLSDIMIIPLLSLLGLLIGVAIYKAGLTYIPCMIACSVISLVTGLSIGLRHAKTTAHSSKIKFCLIGLIYPLSFTLGVGFLLLVKP
jgi:uncharacterized membrane protein